MVVGRGRVREDAPVAATRGRSPSRSVAAAPVVAGTAAAAASLVALPGERLARAAGGLSEADLAAAEVFTMDDLSDDGTNAADESGPIEARPEDGEPRRRRRRGGRGRGRGRGRPDEAQEGQPDEAAPAVRTPIARTTAAPAREIVDEDEEIVPARRAPRTTPFGSVWDSQLGTPSAPAAASLAPLVDEEDFDEPEIPEYLIAEQRRGANRGVAAVAAVADEVFAAAARPISQPWSASASGTEGPAAGWLVAAVGVSIDTRT